MRQALNPEFAVKAAANSLAMWHQIDKVLGLGERPTNQIPPEILALATDREECRKLKDFKHADAIRKLIESKGYLVEDTPKGPKLKKI
jgi:cysteinyl-tRNA synthetase